MSDSTSSKGPEASMNAKQSSDGNACAEKHGIKFAGITLLTNEYINSGALARIILAGAP